MLLQKQSGNADKNRQHRQGQQPSRLAQAFCVGRRYQGGQGADDVLRGEHIGGGVHRVEKAHHTAQEIVPWQLRRAQILTAGVQQEHHRGHGHGNAQELTVAAEGIHIIQKRIQVHAHDEKIPAHIED